MDRVFGTRKVAGFMPLYQPPFSVQPLAIRPSGSIRVCGLVTYATERSRHLEAERLSALLNRLCRHPTPAVPDLAESERSQA